MRTNTEALRLADELCAPVPDYPAPTSLEEAAAHELRRLHAENERLRRELQIAYLGLPHGSYKAAIARAESPAQPVDSPALPS